VNCLAIKVHRVAQGRDPAAAPGPAAGSALEFEDEPRNLLAIQVLALACRGDFSTAFAASEDQDMNKFLRVERCHERKLQRFSLGAIRPDIYFFSNIAVHTLIYSPYHLAKVNTVLSLTNPQASFALL
jgi:hypothetical protein